MSANSASCIAGFHNRFSRDLREIRAESSPTALQLIEAMHREGIKTKTPDKCLKEIMFKPSANDRLTDRPTLLSQYVIAIGRPSAAVSHLQSTQWFASLVRKYLW